MKDSADDIEKAGEAVAQLFSAAGKEMTSMEVALWLREIARFGARPVLQFAEFWMQGGGQSERFRQAPTIEDFRRRADPGYVSEHDALERLRLEVASCGPYAAPAIEDARLKAAVLLLGGWAKVCQDMPDASDEFAARRFAERFARIWVQAEGMALRGEVNAAVPLVGLAGSRLPQSLQGPLAHRLAARPRMVL